MNPKYAVILNLLSATVWAQPAISFNDALTFANEQNPTLAKTRAETQASEARVTEAAGIDDFALETTSTWSTNRTPMLLGQPSPGYAHRLSLGTGISRSLPTGGRVGLRLNVDWNEFITGQSYTPSAVLYFTHPLLKGAGPDMARAAQRKSRILLSAAEFQQQSVALSLQRELLRAHTELNYTKAELEIRTESLTRAQDQLELVNANIAVGKLPTSASAEVEVVIALRKEDVLMAEQRFRARSYEFSRLLGLESQRFTAANDFTPHTFEMPQLENNPELQAAEALVRAAAIDLQVAENNLLPQVDLNLSAGPVGNAGGPSAAISQLVRFDGYLAQAGVTISYALGQRAARGQSQAAAELLRKARLTVTEVTLRLQADYRSAADALSAAKEREALLVQATAVATLSLEAEQARFAVGRGSSFDVLRRQDELAQVRIRKARAQADVHFLLPFVPLVHPRQSNR